ncbi:hypothetical protein M8494_03055 [Serratia ureilytica]
MARQRNGARRRRVNAAQPPSDRPRGGRGGDAGGCGLLIGITTRRLRWRCGARRVNAGSTSNGARVENPQGWPHFQLAFRDYPA